MKRSSFRLLGYVLPAIAGLLWLGVLGVAGAYVYLERSLPSADAMRRVELQVPLRIYTRSGQLIQQIGEKRLIPVTFEEIPPLVRQAVLAAEDDRFFSHHGVDWLGVARAVFKNLTSANLAGQGGSTITMQAARNMFLTLDKTARRKASEIFVTFRMERDFTKEEILATYLNVIFFGQRSYGVAAAAETFYGKRLDQLTVGEAATLAGIIQSPSRYNPVASPQLAQMRRTYVLRRMQELGYIDEATAARANAERVASRGFAPLYDVEAPYVAELARLDLVARFGPQAVNSGYKVFTTVDGRLQSAANRAVRLGLIEYDRRHGYRGPLAQVKLPPALEPEKLEALIGSRESVGILQVAVVTDVQETSARVYIRNQGNARIDWDGMSWARPVRNGRPGAMPKKAGDVLAPGDVIHVVSDRRGNAVLAQVPEAQGALVAVDPQDGAIVSLVGGFDFYLNRFNRATQANRQPGSGFKPFIYSAALDHGMTPASIILDAPLVDEAAEGGWRPQNDNQEWGGPTRLREGLVRSLNMVSIRLLRDVGTDTAIEHASRFGFNPDALPNNLTLALGTLSATPLQMATGYAVFANGGFKVEPYLIERIENAAGEVLYQAEPKVVCEDCEHLLDPQAPAGAPGETVPAVATEETFGEPLPGPPPPTPAAEAAAARLLATIDRRNAGVPSALASMAALQGGPGFLPPERIAPRAISAENAWLMTSIMSDVVRRGTAVRARALNRDDLAGKTGTSQQVRDAWFNGYNGRIAASAWVGFDEERSLGASEQGSRTALPIWIHFMREALRGVPDTQRPMPPGLISLRISPRTGAVAGPFDPDAITEHFMVDNLPPGAGTIGPDGEVTPAPGSDGGGSTDPLF